MGGFKDLRQHTKLKQAKTRLMGFAHTQVHIVISRALAKKILHNAVATRNFTPLKIKLTGLRSQSSNSVVKYLLTASLAIVCSVGMAHAGFTERKMKSTMSSAEKSGKLVAFIFYEDFLHYIEPKDVDAANARNNAAKKAIPRAGVLLIEINKGDKEMDKLPACVSTEGKTPRVVITDPKGEKVIVEYQGAPGRDKEKEIEEKVEAARAKLKGGEFLKD